MNCGFAIHICSLNAAVSYKLQLESYVVAFARHQQNESLNVEIDRGKIQAKAVIKELSFMRTENCCQNEYSNRITKNVIKDSQRSLGQRQDAQRTR